MTAMEYKEFVGLVRGLRSGYVAARQIESRRALGAAGGLRAAVLDLVRWGKAHRPVAVRRMQIAKRHADG